MVRQKSFILSFLLVAGLLGGVVSAKEPRGLADEAITPILEDIHPDRDEAADQPAHPEGAIPLSQEEMPLPAPDEEPPLQPQEGTGLPPAPEAPILEGEIGPLEPLPPAPAEIHLSLTPKYSRVDLTTNSYKAEEFRILPEGFYLDRFSLSRVREDRMLDLSLRHLLLLNDFRNGRVMEDSHGRLTYDQYGWTTIEVDYRKVPHLYASRLQGSIPTLSTPRDQQGVHLRFTPDHPLVLQLDLSFEERKGKRPLPTENATALASDGTIDSTAVLELAEPIHYRTMTLSLGAEYLNGPLILQFENRFQFFNNRRPTTMEWGPSFDPSLNSGRGKLPEDHWIQTLTLQPSYRFSDRWMWMNSLSYHTVTSRIHLVSFSSDPNLGSPLPAPVVEPDVRSLLFHSALTGEITDDLSLKIRYRMNSNENDTLILTPHPAYVLLEEEVRFARTPVYISHRKNLYEMEANYHPVRWGSIQGGIRQTDRTRSQREVQRETERRYFLNLRGTWHGRVTGNAGYAFLSVDPDRYNAGWLKNTYDPTATESQHPLMRALDLARSTSDEFHGGVTYAPFDPLSMGVRFTAENKSYPETLVGRQSSENLRTTIDLQYTPTDRLLAYTQVNFRQLDYRGRYTWTFDPVLISPSQDPTEIDFRVPQTEIVSEKTDDYLVGVEFLPSTLTRLTGQYLISSNRTEARLFPSTEYRFEEFSLEVSRKIPEAGKNFPRDLTLAFEYRYEKSSRVDYALDNFPAPGDPANPASPDDLYLGITDPGYTAHVVSFSCTFSF